MRSLSFTDVFRTLPGWKEALSNTIRVVDSVMALAARWCPLAPSLVVVLWSGLCALIYAARHRMPCEGSFSRTHADD